MLDGSFTYSDGAFALFLGVDAGAVFQVVWSIVTQRAKTDEGNLFHPGNAAGFLLDMIVMWA